MQKENERAIEWVTIRDLSHRGAEIFDRVELEGAKLVVTRDRRPIALLTPLEPYARRFGNPPAPRQEEPLPDLELDETQKAILLAAAEITPTPWHPNEMHELRAVSLLDVEGLLRKGWFGYDLSGLGLRLARKIEAESG